MHLTVYLPCLAASSGVGRSQRQILIRMYEETGVDGLAMVERLKAGRVRADVFLLILRFKGGPVEMAQIVSPCRNHIVLI